MDGVLGLVTNYIKTAPDGSLTMEDTGRIFRINVYELEKKAGDVSSPFAWKPGYATGTIGGLAGVLSMAGLKPTNQKFEISALNPLYYDVPVTSSSYYVCYNNQYEVVHKGTLDQLNSFTLPYSSSTKILLSEEVPSDVEGRVSSISMDDLTFNLPFPGLPIKNIKLPIERFRVSDCSVYVVVQNTLPFNVSVSNFRALTRNNPESEEPEEDFNISITTDVDIAGGSLENPAESTIELSINALEGTLPDIEGLMFDLLCSNQQGLGTVALSANQGLYIKSAFATLKGGITIPQE